MLQGLSLAALDYSDQVRKTSVLCPAVLKLDPHRLLLPHNSTGRAACVGKGRETEPHSHVQSASIPEAAGKVSGLRAQTSE